jgi:hypothetical protein
LPFGHNYDDRPFLSDFNNADRVLKRMRAILVVEQAAGFAAASKIRPEMKNEWNDQARPARLDDAASKSHI